MEKEELVIDLPSKMVVLSSVTYENEIDVDSALKIDYANILGEILTFPVFLNRIGVLLAEADDNVRQSEFDIEIEGKEVKLEYQKAEQRARTSLKQSGIKSPTAKEIENSAYQDQTYIDKQDEYREAYREYLNIKKMRDQINSLYWSAKSKDTKLDKISEKIRPDDFEDEILEGTVNGIMIKCTEKLLK